jgi:hypothetical protein
VDEHRVRSTGTWHEDEDGDALSWTATTDATSTSTVAHRRDAQQDVPLTPVLSSSSPA